MPGARRHFRHIVVLDFEYEITGGGLPNVLCLVAYLLDETFNTLKPCDAGEASSALRRRFRSLTSEPSVSSCGGLADPRREQFLGLEQAEMAWAHSEQRLEVLEEIERTSIEQQEIVFLTEFTGERSMGGNQDGGAAIVARALAGALGEVEVQVHVV